ncbi:MAG TPA: hypothetical protein VHN99_05880 [Deinococcales bacterium]|nr:hypothetical protein [Deinococcales bacterium]
MNDVPFLTQMNAGERLRDLRREAQAEARWRSAVHESRGPRPAAAARTAGPGRLRRKA